MSENKLTRRRFLRGAAMAAVSALAASCAQPTPQVIEKPVTVVVEKEVPVEKQVLATVVVEKPVTVEKVVQQTVVVEKEKIVQETVIVKETVSVEKVVTATPEPIKYKEAPMLADLVKAGTLPPVDERVSDEPLVLDMVDSVGKYGGGWLFLDTPDATTFGNMQMTCHENFLRYTRDTTGLRPNLITGFAWNADGTELTLFLRMGIKWSDGEPLTIDDWIWWWDNMVNDDKIKIAPPTGTKVAGELMKLTKVDDYTVKCSFAAPNPLFHGQMNRGSGARSTSWQCVPSHYFETLHPRFNSAVKDTDVATGIIAQYNDRLNYPGLPHNAAWVTKEILPGQKLTLERNPYYWKVDPEGNQLPYMDTLECRLADQQLIILSSVNGEPDFEFRKFPTTELPTLKAGEAKGNYKMYLWPAGSANNAGVIINYCAESDKGLHTLIWDQKFRQALHWGIDKQRICDVVFLGLADPTAFAMIKEGAEYQTPRGQQVWKDWSTQCVPYEPDTAKKLLDELGVIDKNNDGWREQPDGSKLEMIVDCDNNDKGLIDAETLIVQDWQKLGLNAILNVIEPTVREQRWENCDTPFRARGGAASGLIAAPGHWAPVEQSDYCVCGYQYGLYYQTKGAQGIAPPPGSFIEKLQKIYDDAIKITDDAKRNDRVLDGYQVHIDEGPIQIGTAGNVKVPVMISNRLHNVWTTGGLVNSWTYGMPGTLDPETWWKA